MGVLRPTASGVLRRQLLRREQAFNTSSCSATQETEFSRQSPDLKGI
jgi:hypothetical protein